MSRTIVVVEDDNCVLELLHDLLTGEGFRVIEVAHPDQLHQLACVLKGVEPDLFLIGIMLPRATGIEVAMQLRARGYARTPMIALTASKLTALTALQSGVFDEIIEKPFEISELLGAIARQLGVRQAQPVGPTPVGELAKEKRGAISGPMR